MVTCCSVATASGGPASSNRASRVRAAWSREAMSALYLAFCLYRATSWRSLACSSSHRRRSSSSRLVRSARAAGKVANEPPCTHAVAPAGPGSSAATCVAVRESSSRSWLTNSTPLAVASSWSSSHRLVGTSRELSGSSSTSSSAGPRSRAVSTSRLASPPDSDVTARHCARSNGCASTSWVISSHSASAA